MLPNSLKRSIYLLGYRRQLASSKFIVSHLFWSVYILHLIPHVFLFFLFFLFVFFPAERGNDGKGGPAGGDNQDDGDWTHNYWWHSLHFKVKREAAWWNLTPQMTELGGRDLEIRKLANEKCCQRGEWRDKLEKKEEKWKTSRVTEVVAGKMENKKGKLQCRNGEQKKAPKQWSWRILNK